MLGHLHAASQKELAKRLEDKALTSTKLQTNAAMFCILHTCGICVRTYHKISLHTLAVNVFLRQQCSAHWFGLFLLLQAKQKQFITQLIVQGLLMLLEVPLTMILLPGISQSANLRDL
jgi:hypothetical protein